MLVIGHEAEIGGILVPSGKGRAVGLLDKPSRRVDEDIGPDQILDGVEDALVADERVDPGKEEVATRAPAEIALIDRRAEPLFEAGKPGVAFRQLLRR